MQHGSANDSIPNVRAGSGGHANPLICCPKLQERDSTAAALQLYGSLPCALAANKALFVDGDTAVLVTRCQGSPVLLRCPSQLLTRGMYQSWTVSALIVHTVKHMKDACSQETKTRLRDRTVRADVSCLYPRPASRGVWLPQLYGCVLRCGKPQAQRINTCGARWRVEYR